MTTLKPTKIGDRVRFLGHLKDNFGEVKKPVGALGTVVSKYPFENGIGIGGDALYVAWDGHPSAATWMENVELVVDGTPVPTPADPELQALRERLLDLAVQSAEGAGTQYIVETAKAFEAYVTGDTK